MNITSTKYLAKRLISNAAYLSGIIRRRRSQAGLLILMFHKINDNPDTLPLTLKTNLFEKLILEIKKHHDIIPIETVRLDQKDILQSNGLKVALTFDDGYLDNYTNAFPILNKHKIPATIYLSTDHIDGKRVFWYEQISHAILMSNQSALMLDDIGYGNHRLESVFDRTNALHHLNTTLKDLKEDQRSNIASLILKRSGAENTFKSSEMLDWDIIRKMHKCGINFGSHTITHPILSKETRTRIQYEVGESKLIIERELGEPVISFAYPNGTPADFNDTVIAMVKNAGYINACTTVNGINTVDTPIHTLCRVNISNEICTKRDGSFDDRYFWARALNLF
jgi:peptidoglycan/xylan/chitin deacetylase (PgdA/CDA1 family)